VSQASIAYTLRSRSLRARQRLRCAKAALALAIVFSVSAGAPTIAAADEGGVSFWLPGLFGSLAAAPQQPGWSLATIYYHDSVSAGADVGRAREFTIGNIPINASANLSARLNSNIDLALVVPTYTFANSFFGGQAALSLMGIYGGVNTSLAGTVQATGSAVSNRGSWASGRRSATSFRSARCRPISMSKATGNSTPRTALMAGTPGSRSNSLRRRRARSRHRRRFVGCTRSSGRELPQALALISDELNARRCDLRDRATNGCLLLVLWAAPPPGA
jgi:hypothetical protein